MNAKGILRAADPPGFTIQHIAAVEPRRQARQTQVQVAEYKLALLDAVPDLEERIANLAGCPSLLPTAEKACNASTCA